MLQILLLICLLFAAPAVLEPDRQDNPTFMGYWYSGASPYPTYLTNASGWKWTTTSDTIVGWCQETGSICGFWTTCIDRTRIAETTSEVCDYGYSCGTISVYQTPPDGGPSATYINCVYNFPVHTLFRDIPNTVTTTSIIESSTLTAEISSSESLPNPTTSGDNDSNRSESPSNTSKAWISGPIIGGVAVLAMVGAGIYWFGRRSGRGGAGGNMNQAANTVPAYTPPAVQEPKHQEPSPRPYSYRMSDTVAPHPSPLGTENSATTAVPRSNSWGNSQPISMELPGRRE